MAGEETTGYPGNEDTYLYSVGEVCSMANTTRKTLFYYDRIGLLEPTLRKGEQKFKLYDMSKVQRLNQILQYRDAGLSISEIRELLDGKNVDHLRVLQSALARMLAEQEDRQERIGKLQRLIEEEKSSRGGG